MLARASRACSTWSRRIVSEVGRGQESGGLYRELRKDVDRSTTGPGACRTQTSLDVHSSKSKRCRCREVKRVKFARSGGSFAPPFLLPFFFFSFPPRNASSGAVLEPSESMTQRASASRPTARAGRPCEPLLHLRAQPAVSPCGEEAQRLARRPPALRISARSLRPAPRRGAEWRPAIGRCQRRAAPRRLPFNSPHGNTHAAPPPRAPHTWTRRPAPRRVRFIRRMETPTPRPQPPHTWTRRRAPPPREICRSHSRSPHARRAHASITAHGEMGRRRLTSYCTVL